MRRTLIFGVVGATTLTVGLALGATLATADPSSTTPTDPIAMMGAANGIRMIDANDMTSMMNGTGMTNSMDANGMTAMHTLMHDALLGTVSADVLAACDSAHASMIDALTPSSTDTGSGHPCLRHAGRSGPTLERNCLEPLP